MKFVKKEQKKLLKKKVKLILASWVDFIIMKKKDGMKLCKTM